MKPVPVIAAILVLLKLSDDVTAVDVCLTLRGQDSQLTCTSQQLLPSLPAPPPAELPCKSEPSPAFKKRGGCLSPPPLFSANHTHSIKVGIYGKLLVRQILSFQLLMSFGAVLHPSNQFGSLVIWYGKQLQLACVYLIFLQEFRQYIKRALNDNFAFFLPLHFSVFYTQFVLIFPVLHLLPGLRYTKICKLSTLPNTSSF